jgi:hypothetical protein
MKIALIGSFLLPSESIRHQPRGATPAGFIMWTENPVNLSPPAVATFLKGANPEVMRGSVDGASRTRTGDLLGAIQALSQLSYSPVAG